MSDISIFNYFVTRWPSGYGHVSDSPNVVSLEIEEAIKKSNLSPREPTFSYRYISRQALAIGVLKCDVVIKAHSRPVTYAHAVAVRPVKNMPRLENAIRDEYINVYGQEPLALMTELVERAASVGKDRGRGLLEKLRISSLPTECLERARDHPKLTEERSPDLLTNAEEIPRESTESNTLSEDSTEITDKLIQPPTPKGHYIKILLRDGLVASLLILLFLTASYVIQDSLVSRKISDRVKKEFDSRSGENLESLVERSVRDLVDESLRNLNEGPARRAFLDLLQDREAQELIINNTANEITRLLRSQGAEEEIRLIFDQRFSELMAQGPLRSEIDLLKEKDSYLERQIIGHEDITSIVLRNLSAATEKGGEIEVAIAAAIQAATLETSREPDIPDTDSNSIASPRLGALETEIARLKTELASRSDSRRSQQETHYLSMREGKEHDLFLAAGTIRLEAKKSKPPAVFDLLIEDSGDLRGPIPLYGGDKVEFKVGAKVYRLTLVSASGVWANIKVVEK